MRAYVVHWNPLELMDKIQCVEEAGARVVASQAEDGKMAFEEIRAQRVDVVILWLQWKPSHGRVLAAAIRSTAWGRRIPILFIVDDPDPIPSRTLNGVRAAIPDALVDVPGRIPFWLQRIDALPGHNNP